MFSFKPTVQRKVFFAILALTAATLALLVATTQWNLSQGFGRYLAESELLRFDGLVKRLGDEYQRNGGWDRLAADPAAWRRFLEESRPDEREGPGEPRGGPPRPDGHFHDRPPPGGGHFPPGKRLILLDAQGKRVAGGNNERGASVARPILVDGRLVGRLSMEIPPAPGGAQATDFLIRQNSALWLAGGAALLLACIAAWWLSRYFLAPIRQLAEAARQIASGRYAVRITLRQGDELGDLADDFNRMAENLAQVEESRRQWISDTSHELRTPLAVLQAEVEALQDGVRSAGPASYARLAKQIAQLNKLVDDLRHTLDGGTEGITLECRPIAPLTLLGEAIEQFAPRFASARIALDGSQLPAEGPLIEGDADRLRQVFANLLENSLRYTDPGGRLQLTAGLAGNTWWIGFDDTAPAPSPAAMPRLFERFFRGEASRSRAHGGSGLGLAIAKTLVEAHGGTISAAASPLGGLAIRVNFPVEEAQ